MKALLFRTDRWLWRMDYVFIAIAGLAVMAMMVLTAADVVMRYAFHQPIRWAFELVTQYLLIGSFFFAFSYTLRTNENVAVDYFARHIPLKVYHPLMGAGHLVAAVIFAGICWLSARDTYEAWLNNDALMGALIWPTWSAKVIVPIGAVALSLRLFHRAFAHWCSTGDEGFREAIGLENSRQLLVKD
ncbi:MAG: TRAP transporter small permease [Simplicispira sp.]|nr:TRAP transporter small permease [Simplicispira sp.]